ncbi:MAG TPA: hypothetical protein VFL41_09335 [Gaiellaceae bacterium]|nr:hypothetical protein [Gaiellaceae bacterium]
MQNLGSAALAEPRPVVAVEAERKSRLVDGVPTAELAECTCPEFCERDHDTD